MLQRSFQPGPCQAGSAQNNGQNKFQIGVRLITADDLPFSMLSKDWGFTPRLHVAVLPMPRCTCPAHTRRRTPTSRDTWNAPHTPQPQRRSAKAAQLLEGGKPGQCTRMHSLVVCGLFVGACGELKHIHGRNVGIKI